MADQDGNKKMADDGCGGAMASDRTTVSIDVKPVIEHKKQVICDIMPSSHNKGEKLQLKNGKYRLEFNLVDGTPNDVAFETDNGSHCRAIYFDEDGCPGNNNGNMPADQVFTPKRESDSKLVVEADVSGDPYAVHYRLNFNKNRYFDPIIIHD